MTKESDIQKQIFDYCTTIAEKHGKDIFFFSIPNEGIMTVLKMFKIPDRICHAIVAHFKKMGLVPGTPDTCLLYSGKSYFFEIKKPDQEPTASQKRIHAKIRKTGNAVFVVKSLEEFQNIIKTIGIIR